MAPRKKTHTTAAAAAAPAAGRVVELADKDGGFYDPQTQFKVVRSQRVPLGPTVGRQTNLALLSGALLVVGGPKAAADEAPAEDDS